MSVAILDGTDTSAADTLRTALGTPAHLSAPEDLPGAGAAALLLLPAHAPVLPTEALRLVAVLESLALNPPGHRTPLVLTWVATPAHRTRMSYAAGRNHADLLLGKHWTRELAHHPTPTAAAACRAARVRKLMRAQPRLGGIPVTTLHRTLSTLDPHFVEALCVQLPDGTWHSPAAVAAAVELRGAAAVELRDPAPSG
ncbi:hypothetical protein [Actinokineospora spheciospongiae]|uniref:hypothetical protein n=1 Tax=Actinokineospora spheciospongiae TaxID=909613 RepID=UPI000D716DB8|nr:hypothetical protein [Actinokineospora spheciospongiae]PWW59506.1 hypothetical protein DFQ13_108143 [Actinokineospora spheciospongiae]